jgi:cellulose synthase/poly-beta-1,6-N-acetylglucosamine synthase-like glycosyltransferase
VLCFWIFVGPAIFLAIIALRGERKRAEYVAARMAELGEPSSQPLPPVTLIVPVTKPCESIGECLRSLAAQDYPDYETIVVVAEAGVLPPGVLPSGVRVALTGDASRSRLLKAGVRAAMRRSHVLAFAGSSGVVSAAWLRALVVPLAEAGVGASTGFRWYACEPPRFWSLMQSVWNAVIAGRLGPGPSEFAWGAAMAITKDVLFQENITELWTSAEREDLALSRAVINSRRSIAFAPGAMVACTRCATVGQFLRQARREMAQARVSLPGLWWSGLASHILYCGAMLAAIIASVHGNRGAEWAVVALFGLGMLKGANRATLAKAELPHIEGWFSRYSWTHAFWTPLATWLWLCVLVASAFPRNERI